VQGHKDAPLSPRGLRQTKLVGEYVNSNFSIDRVVSSDLSRCVDTASGIDAPISTSPLLRELDFGEWEGQKWSDLSARGRKESEMMRRLQSGDTNFTPPGGERVSRMNARVEQVIIDENLRNSSQTIAVVSHGGGLKSLAVSILGWPATTAVNLTFFVGSVSSISVSDSIPKLDLLNHFEHLNPSYVNAGAGDSSGRPLN